MKRSGTRPAWLQGNNLNGALKVRNISVNYSALSELKRCLRCYQGRRASRCSALAPGFHIPRLWRLLPPFIYAPWPGTWLSYSEPLALALGFHVPRLWRWHLAFISRAFGAGWLSYSAPLALALGFHISRLCRWQLANFCAEPYQVIKENAVSYTAPHGSISTPSA